MKRAIILAGGKGTRLRPYTTVLPKPLMPIGDFPIIEVVIRQLRKSGFKDITIAVNHQAEIICAYFGDGRKFGLNISYSHESEPLGTMGPLKLIQNLPENFLVMNGDILTDLNFEAFYDDHSSSGSVFTISSYERTEQVDYGVLEVDNSSNLLRFTEKPRNKYLVSMGIYMLNRKLIDNFPPHSYGFDNLMHDLIAKEERVRVKIHNGYWLDIGRPDDYMRAIEEFDSMKDVFI